MEVLTVFRGGRWIEYVPRIVMQVDPRITQPLRQKAASVYVSAIQKGFQEERAHMIAEAYVFKDLYKELQYDTSLEAELEQVKDRGGKA